jgi:hypothetical protein
MFRELLLMILWNNHYKIMSFKLSLISYSSPTRKSTKMILKQLNRKEHRLSWFPLKRNLLMLKPLQSLRLSMCRPFLSLLRPKIREKTHNDIQREVEPPPNSKLRESLKLHRRQNSKNQLTMRMMTSFRCPLQRAKHKDNKASCRNSVAGVIKSTKLRETIKL